jgi:hypothetical protein
METDVSAKPYTSASTKYIVDKEGQIRPVNRIGWAREAFSEARSLDECLSKWTNVIKDDFISIDDYISSEECASEFVTKFYLDIVDGFTIVTGIFEDNTYFRVKWGDEIYFTARPDFLKSCIVQNLSEAPLNEIENFVRDELINYIEIEAIHLAIRAGELDPDGLYPIEWWKQFWKSRGVVILVDFDKAASHAKGETILVEGDNRALAHPPTLGGSSAELDGSSTDSPLHSRRSALTQIKNAYNDLCSGDEAYAGKTYKFQHNEVLRHLDKRPTDRGFSMSSFKRAIGAKH